MTSKEILDILNSAPVFGVLAVIAVGIMLLLFKKDVRPKSSRR